ncbi:aminoglycoside phosphotransferase [Actinoplanes sp. LDG1-06]|uniref:Aminoglycoside phosphotransferase n=1 Tax=Paractinoplanes ovalisporus TaxID=2810368 RepID=A0ABS2AI91_9ACTN|nr:aminoglycoside phosphotransferase family protein [Actinoplanes ovalisporus]MBM2619573.1 aminoglycoside phosphotransferase [Actinoplanes ovalisporus]
MDAWEMPANLLERDKGWPPFEEWLAELPEVVAGLAERWGLELGRPFQPGGTVSWVAPVPGDRVLKVSWMHDEARDEATALRVWEGRGTVRLLRSEVFGQTNALLLERCRPGTTLADALSPPDQDEVVASLLPRLWVEAPPGFQTLTAMADDWAGRVDPDRLPDRGLARAGLDVWRELPRTAVRETLLCTDLHPGNVLRAEREPWLIVDPKPYVGDPDYEPVQHMLNFHDRLLADPGGFADRMAHLLDLDAARVRLYLGARCVLETPRDPHLWTVVEALGGGF